MHSADPTITPEALLAALMADIYNILGIQGKRALYRPVDWLTRRPLLRFCEAFATTDAIMARDGFCVAADWLVRTWFARDIRVRGQEQVPAEGPLLVISNHPGAFDSAAIGASLGRDDLRIIASNAPFLRRLPTVSQHLIFIAEDAIGRMNTIREGVRHLAAGGALLVFGTGLIDPDPGFMPGAEQALEEWYGSAEIFLRKAPETRLVLAVASDVLHPPITRNPLARLHRERWKRQRMAEFLQFVRQLTWPHQLWLHPKISFGAPVTLAGLEAAVPEERRLLAAVIEAEKGLLAGHMRAFYG